MAQDSIAIDIGEKYTRIAEAHQKGKNFEIQSLVIAETNPDFYIAFTQKNIEAQATIIMDLFRKLKTNKKNVHLIIPDTYSYSQVLEVPKLNERELQSAIRYQADQFIPLPIDEISLDIEVINDNQPNKKTSILTVASPKTVVSQLEKTIQLAGLYSISMENELSCIRRFYSEFLKPTHQASYLVFNFGYSSSSIYLFDKFNQLMLSRNFKLGLELMIKDLKLNLNTDGIKALELLKTVGFEKNTSVDIESVVHPIINEIIIELNKFILMAKEKFGFELEKILIFNHDNFIHLFPEKIASLLSLTTESVNFSNNFVLTPQLQSYNKEISTYLAAISGNFR